MSSVLYSLELETKMKKDNTISNTITFASLLDKVRQITFFKTDSDAYMMEVTFNDSTTFITGNKEFNALLSHAKRRVLPLT